MEHSGGPAPGLEQARGPAERGAAALGGRALRGLALIVASLLALVGVIAVYRRPVGAAAPAPQPDLASGMDWISYREGWLSIFDRPGGRSVLLHTTDAGGHWTRERAATALETIDFFDPRHGVLTSQRAPAQTESPADPASPATTTYRRRDGGRHWERLTSPSGAGAPRPSFADHRHGWVWDPSPAGLYATGAGGGHWPRPAARGLPGAGPAPAARGFR